MGLNLSQHRFEVYFKYRILLLDSEYGTNIVNVIEASIAGKEFGETSPALTGTSSGPLVWGITFLNGL